MAGCIRNLHLSISYVQGVSENRPSTFSNIRLKRHLRATFLSPPPIYAWTLDIVPHRKRLSTIHIQRRLIGEKS